MFDGNGPVYVADSKCCAKCKTPYGHSALAGVCCHREQS